MFLLPLWAFMACPRVTFTFTSTRVWYNSACCEYDNESEDWLNMGNSHAYCMGQILSMDFAASNEGAIWKKLIKNRTESLHNKEH
jgi:hypothetical protein